MHQALRMHQHLDALAGHREQVMRLDDFQALVHQRRRIDRDLRPHRPLRVCHRLRRGDLGQLGTAAATERAAGGGQQDPAYAGPLDAGIARAQALEDRAVFAVDRDDFGAGTFGGAGQQLAGQHQRLLVGQQDALAGRCGGQGRGQPGGADDGRDHGVAGIAGGQLVQCGGTRMGLGGQPSLAQAIAQPGVQRLVSDHRVLGTVAR
ncbi:hypothetical protein G6F31_016876 [Rhizopus arrhizus]|nr:hypothetical protein G6F31_016876 [Rhizopus arrhizus]